VLTRTEIKRETQIQCQRDVQLHSDYFCIKILKVQNIPFLDKRNSHNKQDDGDSPPHYQTTYGFVNKDRTAGATN